MHLDGIWVGFALALPFYWFCDHAIESITDKWAERLRTFRARTRGR